MDGSPARVQCSTLSHNVGHSGDLGVELNLSKPPSRSLQSTVLPVGDSSGEGKRRRLPLPELGIPSSLGCRRQSDHPDAPRAAIARSSAERRSQSPQTCRRIALRLQQSQLFPSHFQMSRNEIREYQHHRNYVKRLFRLTHYYRAADPDCWPILGESGCGSVLGFRTQTIKTDANSDPCRDRGCP